MNRLLSNYKALDCAYDEYFSKDVALREDIASITEEIVNLPFAKFKFLQNAVDFAFQKAGITFTSSYSAGYKEEIFPFDVIPRIIPSKDWDYLEKGLIQRVTAINLFLSDIYNGQRILKDKIIPEEIILSSPCYLKELRDVKPIGGVHAHISGIDIIRDATGELKVLEDNVRIPSGVSYVLENRCIMKRLLHKILDNNSIMPVEEYPIKLRNTIDSLNVHKDGIFVVLTPGIYNSAYFEHVFLARKMGCELVEGRDLFTSDDKVYLKTTHGPKLVRSIYARVSDSFLDPDVFQKDSLLGVRGLFNAYRKGNVLLANAMGNGIADEKGIYPYMPNIIKYYLQEDAILKQIETFSCENEQHLQHVLSNFDRLVLKEVNSSGGSGVTITSFKSKKELDALKQKVVANPRNYVAQPLVELSTCPTYINENFHPQRIDLRPFIVTGESSWVLPGGLTRVALQTNGYIVNSSQGGSSKDTWVMR